jgi:hypothetical protein
MIKAKIGVVCGLRKTFDYEAATKIFISKIEELKKIKIVDLKIY